MLGTFRVPTEASICCKLPIKLATSADRHTVLACSLTAPASRNLRGNWERNGPEGHGEAPGICCLLGSKKVVPSERLDIQTCTDTGNQPPVN